jgi:hypothetical protein
VPTILSLCDMTGNWSRPYERAGYEVIRIDIQNGGDVRLMEHVGRPVRGILAAPPCTHFSKAGAWMWDKKGDGAVLEGMSVVDACLRAVAIYRPEWWALENPIGRLRRWLGAPAWAFDPCDFGQLSEADDNDAYTKRTLLWGHFNRPATCPVDPVFPGVKPGHRDRTTHVGSRARAARSATPTGFARAFYLANP